MPTNAADSDMVQKLLRQRQLQEYARKSFSPELDANASINPDDAVEWVFTKDTPFAGVSGNIQFARGQKISYPPMIRQLRDAGAPILPVR
jgi:hypothetical protein